MKLWKGGAVRKQRSGKRRRGILSGSMFLASALCMACPWVVHAEGFESVTGAIDTLKTGFFAVIAGIGVIILGKNIMETAQAYQNQDSAGMSSGLKGIVAGALMAGVGAIVSALGF